MFKLHIHSSYFNARHDNGYWIRIGRNMILLVCPLRAHGAQWSVPVPRFLESLLSPVDTAYRSRCISRGQLVRLVRLTTSSVLFIDHNIKIDSSVFKYGRRKVS